MNSVWMITSGTYEDYKVNGIFSSEENAKIVFDLIKTVEDRYDEFENLKIKEVRLDQGIKEIAEGKKLFHIALDLSGNINIKVTEEIGYKSEGLHKYPDYICGCVWAYNKIEAAEITKKSCQIFNLRRSDHYDRLAKYVSE